MTIRVVDVEQAAHDKLLSRCKLSAEIAIRLGAFHKRGHPNLSEYIYKHWDEESVPPSFETLRHDITVPNIKWYIRNHLVFKHEVWTPDFLIGLTRCGEIKWHRRKFPNFRWRYNDRIAPLLRNSPFGGVVKEPEDERTYSFWIGAPALYLGHSEESLSYMAGVLATGRTIKFRGETYAKYDNRVLPYLHEFGIPIEHSSAQGRKVYISPIWAALLSPLMPEGCREYWCNVKKAVKAKEYAAILWTIYVDSDYKKDGIPYLQSRRTVYSKYKGTRGTVGTLKKLRVDNDLISLDDRFRECVHNWSRKMYNITKEEEL
jgi:hypothetical protein